jgi:hypothetical protein
MEIIYIPKKKNGKLKYWLVLICDKLTDNYRNGNCLYGRIEKAKKIFMNFNKINKYCDKIHKTHIIHKLGFSIKRNKTILTLKHSASIMGYDVNIKQYNNNIYYKLCYKYMPQIDNDWLEEQK